MSKIVKTNKPITAPGFGDVPADESNNSHVGFVLDGSGSMHHYQAKTIAGFNRYLGELHVDMREEALFSMKLFQDDHIDTVHKGIKIEYVGPLSTSTYKPGGMTPLYDTIEKMIIEVEMWKKEHPDGQPIIVVQTDGDDTSSRMYLDQIAAIIRKKQSQGWIFILIAANMDAEALATNLSIPTERALSYSGYKTIEAFVKTAIITKKAAKIESGPAVFSIEDKRDVK